MLEEIALSISTFLFIVCNLVVNSLVPGVPAETNAPSETAAPVMAEISDTETFELVGEWNSGGRVFEFTSSGKLIYGDHVMPYEVDGSVMTVTSRSDGTECVYTLSFEPLSARVMKLNGVTMYKLSEK